MRSKVKEWLDTVNKPTWCSAVQWEMFKVSLNMSILTDFSMYEE